MGILEFIAAVFPGRKLNKWQVKMLEQTQAEGALKMFRNGEVDLPDADAIPFPDGSRLVWDGKEWKVSIDA